MLDRLLIALKLKKAPKPKQPLRPRDLLRPEHRGRWVPATSSNFIGRPAAPTRSYAPTPAPVPDSGSNDLTNALLMHHLLSTAPAPASCHPGEEREKPNLSGGGGDYGGGGATSSWDSGSSSDSSSSGDSSSSSSSSD